MIAPHLVRVQSVYRDTGTQRTTTSNKYIYKESNMYFALINLSRCNCGTVVLTPSTCNVWWPQLHGHALCWTPGPLAKTGELHGHWTQEDPLHGTPFDRNPQSQGAQQSRSVRSELTSLIERLVNRPAGHEEADYGVGNWA